MLKDNKTQNNFISERSLHRQYFSNEEKEKWEDNIKIDP
jgi:hypothetical protein